MSDAYKIWWYSATGDCIRNGQQCKKDDIFEVFVTDVEEKEMEKFTTSEEHAVAIFPVNRRNTLEQQRARAGVVPNYMNKMREAEERARAGVEMGFLK